MPANKLQTTNPQTKPIGESRQPSLLISICIILSVVIIIGPGIIQTSSEQIIHPTAAVIALANARFKGLIFMIFTSLNSVICAKQIIQDHRGQFSRTALNLKTYWFYRELVQTACHV